jgi:hypothetical protein
MSGMYGDDQEHINVWIFLHHSCTRMFDGGTPVVPIHFHDTRQCSFVLYCTYQVSYYHQGIRYHATDLCWIG